MVLLCEKGNESPFEAKYNKWNKMLLFDSFYTAHKLFSMNYQ